LQSAAAGADVGAAGPDLLEKFGLIAAQDNLVIFHAWTIGPGSGAMQTGSYGLKPPRLSCGPLKNSYLASEEIKEAADDLSVARRGGWRPQMANRENR
jgi:hypothetical protein